MANKPEKRYELRSNSAEEEEAEMEQPPKEIEQITMRDIMDAIMVDITSSVLNRNNKMLNLTNLGMKLPIVLTS